VVTSGAAEAAQDLQENKEINDENSGRNNILETPERAGVAHARAGWFIVRIDCSGEKGRRQRAEGGRGKE
jgi:hypothetical protein